jgi:hypothetical protein
MDLNPKSAKVAELPQVIPLVSVKPVTKVQPLAGEVDFTISTDSVVATALVTPNASMRRIVMDWGDGSTDTLTSRPGVRPPDALDQDHDPLPAGTYRLTHVYDAPDDRLPFEHYVLLRVQDWAGGDDIRIANVECTPRYRVTNYRTSVLLPGPCDLGGATNEFDIILFVDGTQRRRWHWEPSNNIFTLGPGYRLEGSQVSRELTVSDGYIGVSFVFTETDFGPDDHLRFDPALRATDDSEHVERRVKQVNGNCELIARYDREVSLMVPLPSTGGGPVFA